MATVPTGTRQREFGQVALTPSYTAICRALRPLPKRIASLYGITIPDVATVSEELLVEAAIAGRADCVYVFCRLNADGVRDLVLKRLSDSALPFRIDPLIAEILAEVADSNRSSIPERVHGLYRSIPDICERVVGNTIDDVLGFVPTFAIRIGSNSLGRALAARLDLPTRLIANLNRVVDAATTHVLVAQALLELSNNDRSLLLASKQPVTKHGSGAISVADLLSIEAARRRFLDEYDRIVRWLLMAMESDPMRSAASSGEESQ